MNSLFSTSPRTIGDIVCKSETFSVGDGLYSEEFYGFDDEFLFEVVGENGTRCTIEELEQDTLRVDRLKHRYFKTLLPLNKRINLRGGEGVGEPAWDHGWHRGDDGQLYEDYEQSIGE